MANFNDDSPSVVDCNADHRRTRLGIAILAHGLCSVADCNACVLYQIVVLRASPTVRVPRLTAPSPMALSRPATQVSDHGAATRYQEVFPTSGRARP